MKFLKTFEHCVCYCYLILTHDSTKPESQLRSFHILRVFKREANKQKQRQNENKKKEDPNPIAFPFLLVGSINKYITSKNGQIYFSNLAVFTQRDLSMFSHFLTL